MKYMSNLESKKKPFIASIKERYSLSKLGSQKNTHHIVLDLGNSCLDYDVGDSVGIYPQHDPELVSRTLHAIKATGNEEVIPKNATSPVPIRDFFTSQANITEISPQLFREIFEKQSNPVKKQKLQILLDPNQREAYKTYINQREVWDFLLENEEVSLSPQDLSDLLMPLLPRFYSIASSPNMVRQELHLTIAPVIYHANGHERRGVCSHYLCHLAPLCQPNVPLFVQPSRNFTIPEDDNAPMIMIGPGTGIAPFRAFMQERIHRQAQGEHWLFFGEWNCAYDFFYEDFWQGLEKQGLLRIDAAFSRDQDHKVYVQHKMQEKGSEIFHWLEKKGAYLFVCGDSKLMARDVDLMLHQIVQEQGHLNEAEARMYIKKLKTSGRYLRDVY